MSASLVVLPLLPLQRGTGDDSGTMCLLVVVGVGGVGGPELIDIHFYWLLVVLIGSVQFAGTEPGGWFASWWQWNCQVSPQLHGA